MSILWTVTSYTHFKGVYDGHDGGDYDDDDDGDNDAPPVIFLWSFYEL